MSNRNRNRIKTLVFQNCNSLLNLSLKHQLIILINQKAFFLNFLGLITNVRKNYSRSNSLQMSESIIVDQILCKRPKKLQLIKLGSLQAEKVGQRRNFKCGLFKIKLKTGRQRHGPPTHYQPKTSRKLQLDFQQLII